jgi:hypothetical protein
VRKGLAGAGPKGAVICFSIARAVIVAFYSIAGPGNNRLRHAVTAGQNFTGSAGFRKTLADRHLRDSRRNHQNRSRNSRQSCCCPRED